MPWGLFFYGFLAVFICIRGKSTDLPFDRNILLCLLFAVIVLSYIDIPIKSGLSVGGITLLTACIVTGVMRYPRRGWRWAACGVCIGALLFVIGGGVFWQLEQFLPPWLPLALPLSALAAALAGGYGEALSAAGIGCELAALAKLILLDGEAGVATLDNFGKIGAGAWLLLWLAGYFKRRQLTNDR